MQNLTARQQRVLHLRFGRESGPTPQHKVAEVLGLSVRTLQRIEHNALRRLRLNSLASGN